MVAIDCITETYKILLQRFSTKTKHDLCAIEFLT